MIFRVLVLSFFVLQITTQNNEKTLLWSATKKLTWNDFQGHPNTNSDAVALTASGITFSYSLKTSGQTIVAFSAEVKAHFYPEKSWFLRNKADAYILKHEQLHFDITELYARIFRKQVSQLEVNPNIKSQLEALHDAINEALNSTQKRYDTESRHSMNKDIQKQWATYIQSELLKLEDYQQY